jgi:outer membrane immunogenic protein
MKQLSFLIVVMMTVFAAQAQTPGFGLKGGLNLASLSKDGNSSAYQNRAGFNAGLFARVPVGPIFAIQPEVVYSSQGTKYTVDLPGGNQEHNLALDYVNVPVMLQANVGAGFFAEAGPQIGFLTKAKDKVGDIESGATSTSDYKKTDVALGFGLGYSGLSGLGLGARYNLGLTDINNSGLSNKLKNNVLQLGLTYRLSGRR